MLFAQNPDVAVSLFLGWRAAGDAQHLCLDIVYCGIYDNDLSRSDLLAGFGRFAIDSDAFVVAGALGLAALFDQTGVLQKKIEACQFFYPSMSSMRFSR